MSFEDLQKNVALKIKQARQERGLLQKDFAKFGFPTRHYQKIESGNLNLTLKTLFKVSEALDTDARRLLGDSGDLEVYRSVFHQCPFGIIVWQLVDANEPRSLVLYDSNRVGARSVYRDLNGAKGKPMLEIFPKSQSQGMLEIFHEVITTGKRRFIPELIRHDEGFPLTVFSTEFVKCGPDLGAAIFTDITEEFMARQQIEKQNQTLREYERLPIPESDRVAELKREVNALLAETGRPLRY